MNDDLLSAYADGELDAATARQVEAYIETNSVAQQTVDMHRETTSLLRAALAESHFDIGPSYHAKTVRLSRLTSPYTWAAAACILAGVFGYAAGVTWPGLVRSDRGNLLTEIAEDHSIYSRETVHLVEVPAAQSDHLKSWLGKRVNRDLVIPDFKTAGLTFAGGRLVVLDGSPVAELMYTREKGLPIALYIVNRGGKQDAIEVARRGDVQLANWDDGSHSYIVVGEASPDMIRDLASMARKQL